MLILAFMWPLKVWLVLAVVNASLTIANTWSVDELAPLDCLPEHGQTIVDLWNDYKSKYGKGYRGPLEVRRQKAWIDNCRHVLEHNTNALNGTQGYVLKLNHLSDMDTKGYHRRMIKLTKSSRRKVEDVLQQHHLNRGELPDEFDWRNEGFHTPTYNQLSCGACYAFSIAHVVEGQVFRTYNRVVKLSVQQMVDCSARRGNYGCAGGSLRNTLRYLTKAGGLEAYESYPYMNRAMLCKHDAARSVVNITNWGILPVGDEELMKKVVYNVGPIAASLNASPKTFQLYHGIYDDMQCPNDTVNHAILIVGYTKDAWILKNWWGEHWGEGGYMRLKRNRNQCGVSNFVAYAMID